MTIVCGTEEVKQSTFTKLAMGFILYAFLTHTMTQDSTGSCNLISIEINNLIECNELLSGTLRTQSTCTKQRKVVAECNLKTLNAPRLL